MKNSSVLVIICVALLAVSCSKPPRQGYTSWKLYPAQKNGKAVYIDRTGKIVLETEFCVAGEFSEGLA